MASTDMVDCVTDTGTTYTTFWNCKNVLHGQCNPPRRTAVTKPIFDLKYAYEKPDCNVAIGTLGDCLKANGKVIGPVLPKPKKKGKKAKRKPKKKK